MQSGAQYDVVMVGAGAAGSILAVALAQIGYQVAIVESQSWPFQNRPGDKRAIALSPISWQVLQSLKLADLLNEHVQRVQKVSVTKDSGIASHHIQADSHNMPSLAYVVFLSKLMHVLAAAFEQYGVDVISESRVEKLEQQDSCVKVYVQGANNLVLSSSLLIGADGINSSVRKHCKIATLEHDYRQSAIVADLELYDYHDATAYEHFTKDGPLALLPTGPRTVNAIFTRTHDDAKKIMQYDDAAFLASLNQTFTLPFNVARVHTRKCFDLHLSMVKTRMAHRIVLFGHASHSIHPVGGQGLNLTIADIASMVEVLIDAKVRDLDIGSWAVLCDYDKRAFPQQKKIQVLTDSFIKIFAAKPWPFNALKEGGFLALRQAPVAKRFAKMMMGYQQKLPSLALGISIQEQLDFQRQKTRGAR